MDPSEHSVSWDDLRLFLAIARCGSLSGAARTVGVSQPTLGRRLRALERGFAQPLLQKTRRGYVATEAGQILLDHARRIEDEALALLRRLQGGNAQLAGLLRLSCAEWFGRHILTPWLVGFCNIHPEVVVELISDTRFLSLDRREADLLFRARRFEEPEVVQRLFTHVAYGIFAAPDYLARHGTPRAGDDGAGHRIVSMHTAYGDAPDVVWLTAKLPGARFGLRSNSRDIQAEACRRVAGIAVLPRIMAAGPGLIELDLGGPLTGRDIWVGFHPDLRGMPRLRALMNFPLHHPRTRPRLESRPCI